MRGKKGLLASAIVAALALTIVTAGASASASPGAAAAKKRCKHRRAAMAKRRCTRKRKRQAEAPQSPVVRATLSWSNFGTSGVDVDLYAFDSSGGRAGNGSNTIPLSSHSGDVAGSAGSETFTDDLFTPQAARDMSFGVCYLADFPGAMSFTLTYVTADGAVHGDSQTFTVSGHFDYPGGAPIPASYCNG
jgi:hypothetical protein